MTKAGHFACDLLKANPSGSEDSDGKPARNVGVINKLETMSDDKTKKGPQDASKINIHEPYELEYWQNILPWTVFVLPLAI